MITVVLRRCSGTGSRMLVVPVVPAVGMAAGLYHQVLTVRII
jgi:hypothetical protein